MLARVVAGGVERALSARLLVAADGGESNTRTLLGVRNEGFDYRQTAVVANVSLAAPHDNRLRTECRASRDDRQAGQQVRALSAEEVTRQLEKEAPHE